MVNRVVQRECGSRSERKCWLPSMTTQGPLMHWHFVLTNTHSTPLQWFTSFNLIAKEWQIQRAKDQAKNAICLFVLWRLPWVSLCVTLQTQTRAESSLQARLGHTRSRSINEKKTTAEQKKSEPCPSLFPWVDVKKVALNAQHWRESFGKSTK